MSIRVYLDTSVYNRPFDDQSQPRIWLETLAVSVILQMVEQDDIELVTSTVLAYETSRNPSDFSRQYIAKVVQAAKITQVVDEPIRQRALALEAEGVKALDALHVACAETASGQYFITCDDRLIRRYRKITGTSLIICDPTEFVRIVTHSSRN
jgi:predicted nucleic acid-binding protein